jgi:2-C-methyl-D-erythritol 4-phosphate cytidylyltransferase
MNRYAIIVAGGKGLRMGSNLPKQFIEIAGKPILMHTIERFYQADPSIKIIVVLPCDEQNLWKSLCERYHFSLPHTVTGGGETRFHSVKNGLALTDKEGIIGIHDGVRPFVAIDVIQRCYAEAERLKAVVPVIEIVDSVRRIIAKDNSNSVDRSNYKLVQTPQVFDAAILHAAYEQPFSPSFTDDASVVESSGTKIHLIQGNRENIKITTPFDAIIAKYLFEWEEKTR